MAVVGAYSLLSDVFLRDRSRVSQRVDRELRQRQREQVRKSTVFKNLATLASTAVRSDEKPSLRAGLEATIEQSGVSVMPERLLTFGGAAGLVLGLAAGLVARNVLAGLTGAAVGAAIPFLYVLWKRRQRLNKM